MEIEFSFETEHGVFKDVLHLPDNHNLSEAEIDTMKQQRLTEWLRVIDDANNDVTSGDMSDELFPELAANRTNQ